MNIHRLPRAGLVPGLVMGLFALYHAAATPLLAQENPVEQVDDNRSVTATSPGGEPAASPAEERPEDQQMPPDARSGDAPDPGEASRPSAQGEGTEQNR